MKTDFQLALEELGSYAIPILSTATPTRTPGQVGTGTLYRHDSELFLITARHVVDRLKNGHIVTSGKDGFIRFDARMVAFDYRKGDGRDHDLCVAHIPSEVVAHLHPHFRIVESDELAAVEHYDKLTFYAFTGYPNSRNRERPVSVGKHVEMKPYFYAGRDFLGLSGLACQDKTDELHFALSFKFDETMNVKLEEKIQPPDPHGISGCGVWMIKLDPATGSVAKKALVGVGIEYLRNGQAFITTRIMPAIWAVHQLRGQIQARPAGPVFRAP